MLTTNHHLNGLAAGSILLLDPPISGRPLPTVPGYDLRVQLACAHRGFTLWCVPLVLGSLFVLLFVAANPLLAKMDQPAEPR